MATPAWYSLPVFTIEQKIFLDNVAVFGDVEDLITDKKVRSDLGDTVFNITVRRPFMPGNYAMHIVGPDRNLSSKFNGNSTAIVCREDVDPSLIHQLLIDSNCDKNDERPDQTTNFIDRYDWMHYRNWNYGEDKLSDSDVDEAEEAFKENFIQSLKDRFKCNLRDLTFFVKAERLKDIIAGTFTLEQDTDSILVMMNNALPDPVIGYVINTDSDADVFVDGDWNYACLLTDAKSKLDFAFVFGDLYVNKHLRRGNRGTFTHDIQKDQFTYNIEDFLYRE